MPGIHRAGISRKGSSQAVGDSFIFWPSEIQYEIISEGEQWLAELAVNWDKLDPSILQLNCDLSALTKQGGGEAAGATYRVRLDGTPGLPDGTELVALTTSHFFYVLPPDGVTGPNFARPAGRGLLKLTGEVIPDSVFCLIKSFTVLVEGA